MRHLGLGLRLAGLQAHGVLFARRAGLQHLGAGGAFRVLQYPVLLDDQGAAERDHHQDAQEAAQDRHQHHPGDLHVETQDHDRGHGDAEAEGDGFPRRTRGLDDVVLQDGGLGDPQPLQQAEKGDRDHRYGDRGRDRQADLEHQVERGGPEHHAQQRADDQMRDGQFRKNDAGRDERSEGGLRGGSPAGFRGVDHAAGYAASRPPFGCGRTAPRPASPR